MEGGNAKQHVAESEHNITIPNYRNTRRSKNKKNNTKKNKKEKILTKLDHFRERMNLPIGSSSIRFPLTPEMIAEKEHLIKEIDARIKAGVYKC